MKCWWCCHDWDGEFLHLPFKYHEKHKTFETMGYFCSWGCMRAFNADSGKYSYDPYISLMRKHMYGYMSPIRPAPSRWALTIFGGPYSIDEFRKYSSNSNDDVRVVTVLPDRREILMSVDTKTEKTNPNLPTDNQLQNKFSKITSSTTSNEPLKLKRPKPLKRDESNLEACLGIVRTKK